MPKYLYNLSYNSFSKTDFKATQKVFIQEKYTMGTTVAKFEKELSKWLNVKNSIMVNSGSSANLLLVSSLLYRTNNKLKNLKKGSEVLVPALSWPTTVWPILQLGLKPVIVDINFKSLAIDLDSAKKLLSSKTKAMFLIHVLGQACEMKDYVKFCRNYNLILLEDCCESFGSFNQNKSVGTFGYGGTFSHYFSHHLNTIEGGTVITNNNKLADDLRSLRSHGWIRDRFDKKIFENKYSNLDPRFLFVLPGYNLRPTEFQAALGLEQLKKIDFLLNQRDKIINIVKDVFIEAPSWLKIIGEKFINSKIKNRFDRKHSWMMIPLLIDHPKFNFMKIINIFEKNGIETRPIISGNILKHPVFNNIKVRSSKNLDTTNYIHKKGFMIGCHGNVTKQSIILLRKTLKELKKL